MDLNNKVIIVTGAGSGMRRELTIQLVKKGASFLDPFTVLLRAGP